MKSNENILDFVGLLLKKSIKDHSLEHYFYNGGEYNRIMLELRNYLNEESND